MDRSAEKEGGNHLEIGAPSVCAYIYIYIYIYVRHVELVCARALKHNRKGVANVISTPAAGVRTQDLMTQTTGVAGGETQRKLSNVCFKLKMLLLPRRGTQTYSFAAERGVHCELCSFVVFCFFVSHVDYLGLVR